jgi:hypothetical protein
MSTSNTSPGISISGETKLKIPLSHLIAVIGTLIACTVTCVTYLQNTQRSVEKLGDKVESNQERTEIQFKVLREDMQAQGRKVWLYEDQFLWVSALEREFRRSEFNIPPANKFRSTP